MEFIVVVVVAAFFGFIGYRIGYSKGRRNPYPRGGSGQTGPGKDFGVEQ